MGDGEGVEGGGGEGGVASTSFGPDGEMHLSEAWSERKNATLPVNPKYIHLFPLYTDKNTLCHHEICTDTRWKDCLFYRGFQMGNGRRGKGICPAHEKQTYGDYGWSRYGSGG